MLECIDEPSDANDERGPGPCKGEVLRRLSVTGASSSPRCERHNDAYRSRVEPLVAEINRRYPRQAPADFDPSYAGERWDEDY